MKSATLATVLAGFLAGGGLAADLSKIDRTIDKLPDLRSKSPEYCLLVFGPEAAKRVWLIHDGDLLYVDRNGNGDLTEPGERVAAEADGSKPEENVFNFLVGEIPDQPRGYKDLRVYWMKLDHVRDDDQVSEFLERNPDGRGCGVRVDVPLEGWQGRGIEGRVLQSASIWDEQGVLQFGSRPADAPIIHFGGPWEISLTGRESWRVGRTSEVYLAMGTPGRGPGTTVHVAYEGVIPPSLMPKLRVLFPPASAGQPGVQESYELTRRCCTYNLYGDVKVPDNVGTGTAKVEISLDSWPGAYVAPTVHDVALLPAGPGPKLQPVSARLLTKLPHDHADGMTCNIHFSPDGKRVIAGDYPGGLVHVWEVASGKQLLTLNMGEGLRSTIKYFSVTPDWKSIISATQDRGKFEKIERDGKTLHRVDYNDVVREWDLNSGKLLRTMQDSPARGYLSLSPCPDGSHFFTLEEVAGEFTSSRPRALSLWNVATGKPRQIYAGNAAAEAFSPDGRRVAISMPSADDLHRHSLKILALPQMTELCTISATTEPCWIDANAFVSDGRLLVGSITVFDAPDKWWDHCQTTLKFWDTATGQEVFSLDAPERNAQISASVGPDGRTLVVSTSGQKVERAHLMLVDVENRTVRHVALPDGVSLGTRVFHPSGKWLALHTQIYPKNERGEELSAEDRSQPRVDCLDLASGEFVESLVMPQIVLWSLAFSPDGGTLATSGAGAVLLWDFRSEPGQDVAAAGR